MLDSSRHTSEVSIEKDLLFVDHRRDSLDDLFDDLLRLDCAVVEVDEVLFNAFILILFLLAESRIVSVNLAGSAHSLHGLLHAVLFLFLELLLDLLVGEFFLCLQLAGLKLAGLACLELLVLVVGLGGLENDLVDVVLVVLLELLETLFHEALATIRSLVVVVQTIHFKALAFLVVVTK